MQRKSILFYLCTAAAFLLILTGFVLAAIFGSPNTQTDKPSKEADYEAKIAAMRQRFPEGTGVHAVMIDDPLREESLYFDETGVLRKFAKDGSAIRVGGDAEMTKSLAKDFCTALSEKTPTGTAATDGDFTFGSEAYRVFFATDAGVFVITPAEGDEVLTLYREALSKLDGRATD